LEEEERIFVQIVKNKMIILLYGKDTYRLRRKIEEIIGEYQKKNPSGLNIKFLEERGSFKDILDEDKQSTMFDEKRLIIVKNVFSSESLKNELLKKYEKISSSDNVFIFYQEGEVKKREKLFDLFPKGKVQEFVPLSSKKLLAWIKSEFAKNNTEADDEAVYKLAEIGGEDLWRIKNEIDKLSLYKKKITKKDVEELVKKDVTANIFQTIEAIADKNKEKAVFLFYDHLEKGDNPLYILSMITYQFRNLIIIRDLIDKEYPYDVMRSKSGLHPFVFKKAYQQANKFSLESLRRIYDKLFLTDLKIKTGQIDPVLAIHLFLFDS
jgi:DNA polymerase III subunit delta